MVQRRSLHGCRAIITGASSGIGRALAMKLAGEGARLIVTARREERLQQLVAEIGRVHEMHQGEPEGAQVWPVAGDITDAHLRQHLIATAQEKLGGLDILVNNAGSGAIGPFADADQQRLRQIMEVNFFAPLELIRLALPVLKEGTAPIIVNVGSVLGHCAVPGKSEYVASKFALHGFTDALRMELAGEGIDVLLVSPSTTDSEFFDQAMDNPEGEKPGRLKMSPNAVARRVVKAIRRGRREIILSTSGKLLVWADRLAPWLVSWLQK